MSETSIPQGELVIGKVVHGAAMNCIIIPYDRPDEWFMEQFFTRGQIEDFARKHNLFIKENE